MLEGRAAIQRDFSRVEKWTDKNHMKYNNSNCRILHLGWNKHVHQ